MIKDGLEAKKYINVTCKGCGKRSRHSIADLSTRLATVKLIATELTPEPNGQVPPVGDVDLRELSTRQLLSAAFPEREKWVTSFHRSGNLGARVDWVLEIHHRFKTGAPVSQKQLGEAKGALVDMKSIGKLVAPVAELSFAEERRGPMLTPRKRDDGVTTTSPIPAS